MKRTQEVTAAVDVTVKPQHKDPARTHQVENGDDQQGADRHGR